MLPRDKWVWKGFPGHYILADRCRFRLHTRIGPYTISTVGAMYENGKLQEVGLNRHYETMVFDLDNTGWEEIDIDSVEVKEDVSNETYDQQAEEMHIKLCEKYAKLV